VEHGAKSLFDTNIYINYFWAIMRRVEAKETGKTLKLKGKLNVDYQLFKFYENEKIDLFWCAWNYWELVEKIRQQLYQGKCVSYGFQMPKEIHEARKYVADLEAGELTVLDMVTKCKICGEDAEIEFANKYTSGGICFSCVKEFYHDHIKDKMNYARKGDERYGKKK